MMTLLLVNYVFIPLQIFRLAYILIHFAINMICCLSLALGDMIIQNHCSNKNFLPNGIIHRSLNSYLRTVIYGVVPSFIVSNQASRAKPHKHSKSRRMSKFASFVLTEMMHMEMEFDLLKIAVSILVDNEKVSQQRENAAKERKIRQRKSWAAF